MCGFVSRSKLFEPKLPVRLKASHLLTNKFAMKSIPTPRRGGSCCCAAMPLTQQQLEDIRSEVFADDVDIISAMQLWSIAEVTAYFESGGTERPTAGAAIVDLTDATQQQPKYPPIATPTPPSAPRSFADFDKTHMTVKKGDSYRIEFPFSSEMLQDEARFGSAWLTRAFRTFGSISKHNSVKIISIKTFVGGGAASKAELEVVVDAVAGILATLDARAAGLTVEERCRTHGECKTVKRPAFLVPCLTPLSTPRK